MWHTLGKVQISHDQNNILYCTPQSVCGEVSRPVVLRFITGLTYSLQDHTLWSSLSFALSLSTTLSLLHTHAH